jgi:UDP-glucose:(heptosyl)LPS alpha-1,3-glucosyltransferase
LTRKRVAGPVKLAIVRQRYTPFGGAERVVERAIDALVARGVHVRIYTRQWPAAADPRIEPVICDPFYVGSLCATRLRRRGDASLARDRPDIVQSRAHAGCDVFRAGDGVHRAWIRTPAYRWALRARAHRGESVSPLQACGRSADVR